MKKLSNRQEEFIKYHKEGDGDCNGQVLREYASEHCRSEQDYFDLAYFYSTAYCCASAVFMYENRERIAEDARSFAEEYKKRLIFQSDRKYVAMLDNFQKMLETWRTGLNRSAGKFRKAFVKGNTVDISRAILEIEQWFFFSRFSAYLFVETYCDIHGLNGTRGKNLSYEGDSMTFVGGLFYVYGMDEDARYVQKRHKIPVDIATLEFLITDLQDAVKEAGGDDNFTKLETSLCAYEKFFKGTRYNGYYADRQLQELVSMKSVKEFARTCEEVYEARAKAIPARYLGERNGWDGIRRELKRSYIERGEIIGLA